MNAPLVISVVDPATDQLTITAHGRNTGDGPAVYYSPDGGTTPGGLTVFADVYFIRVDADHVKLATSNANALAGTAIDITSAGGGTQWMLFGLPYCRNTTYTAGAQVKSADLDAMQDGQVALLRYLLWQTPQNTIQGVQDVETIPILPGNPWLVASGSVPGYAGTTNGLVAITNSDVYYPLKISSWRKKVTRVDVSGHSVGGTTTISLYQANQLGGALAAVAGASATFTSGVDSVKTMKPTTPFQNQAGQVMWLRVQAPAGVTGSLLAADVFGYNAF